MKLRFLRELLYLLAVLLGLSQISGVQAQEPIVDEPDESTVEQQKEPTTTTVPSELSSGFFEAGSDGVYHIFPQDAFIQVRGWLDGGYTFNTDSPTSNFNGPYNAIDRDTAQLNQAYLILERSLTSSNQWGIGFRADVLYGYDYFLTQSKGFEQKDTGAPHWNNNRNGLAIPQLYAEIGTTQLSVKLGHFYTIIGYEGVPSINNFFYSKSYSYQYAGPFTHWGGLAKWKFDDNLTFQAGLVNGWDALDRTTDSPAGIARASYTASNDFWSLSAAIISGSEPSAVPTDFENRTRYSVIFGLRPTERLQYDLHHNFTVQQKGTLDGEVSRWYGIDNYLYYTMTDQWKAGLRFEWFRDEDGTRVGGSPFRGNPNMGPFPGNFYSVSAGLNYLPHPNLLIRPEVRSDWFSGEGKPYNDGESSNQVLLSISGTLKF